MVFDVSLLKVSGQSCEGYFANDLIIFRAMS